MDNIPRYINVKHGLEDPSYLHPLLESILTETNGVIIYQEQVMEIAKQLAGYTLGGADLLRRAMGKKIKIGDGRPARDVRRRAPSSAASMPSSPSTIFDAVAKFASYGFNKSHAAAYALLAYQTAWLKANHPVEFFAAAMTTECANQEKLAAYRQEMRQRGIPLYPPDVNRSRAATSWSRTGPPAPACATRWRRSRAWARRRPTPWSRSGGRGARSGTCTT